MNRCANQEIRRNNAKETPSFATPPSAGTEPSIFFIKKSAARHATGGGVQPRAYRPLENMVGVDMALAQYPQNIIYHRIHIIHD